MAKKKRVPYDSKFDRFIDIYERRTGNVAYTKNWNMTQHFLDWKKREMKKFPKKMSKKATRGYTPSELKTLKLLEKAKRYKGK